MNTNEHGQTFEQWTSLADAEVSRLTGNTGFGTEECGEFPGCGQDAWLSEATPLDYAIMCLEEAGFPFEDAPAPAPKVTRHKGYREASPSKGVAPFGTYVTETITLENGDTLTIRRTHARNGKIEVIRNA